MIKLTARLTEDTHRRLLAAAEADRNSLNAELDWLLNQALDAREETDLVSMIGAEPVTICAECGCLIGLNFAKVHLAACPGVIHR